MSISAVSSTSYARVNVESQWLQQMHDYQALTAAIQSGDLTRITRAFSAWQQDLQAAKPANPQPPKQAPPVEAKTQTNGTSQPFGSNSQANSAFQALIKALQTSNVSGAQTAFAALQKGLQVIGGSRSQTNGVPGSAKDNQDNGNGNGNGGNVTSSVSGSFSSISSSPTGSSASSNTTSGVTFSSSASATAVSVPALDTLS